MVFDTYHLGHDPASVGRIAEIASRVALVQLGDARQPPRGEQSRCPLGQGVIPLRPIVAAFQAAGYEGYYDVELLGEEFEAADYRPLLAHARQAFAELTASM
jgi:sugar phosphate isomerase/epimerase